MNIRQLKQAKEEIALKNEFFEAFKQTDKGCLIKESLVLTFCIVTLCLILTHNISWPGLGPGHNNREIQTTLMLSHFLKNVTKLETYILKQITKKH